MAIMIKSVWAATVVCALAVGTLAGRGAFRTPEVLRLSAVESTFQERIDALRAIEASSSAPSDLAVLFETLVDDLPEWSHHGLKRAGQDLAFDRTLLTRPLPISTDLRYTGIEQVADPGGRVLLMRIEAFAAAAESVAESEPIDGVLKALAQEVNTDVEAAAWLRASRYASSPELDGAVVDVMADTERHWRVRTEAVATVTLRFYQTQRAEIFEKQIARLFVERGSDFVLAATPQMPAARSKDPKFILLLIDSYEAQRARGESGMKPIHQLELALPQPFGDLSSRDFPAVSTEEERAPLYEAVNRWIEREQPQLEAAARQQPDALADDERSPEPSGHPRR